MLLTNWKWRYFALTDDNSDNSVSVFQTRPRRPDRSALGIIHSQNTPPLFVLYFTCAHVFKEREMSRNKVTQVCS